MKFTYPTGEGDLSGKLLDRVVIFDSESETIVYWNMIDLIGFNDEEEDWLRITYYRYNKEKNKWIFAGQTSISDPISSFHEMFVKAVKEKDWIRELFRNVYEKCREDLALEQL